MGVNKFVHSRAIDDLSFILQAHACILALAILLLLWATFFLRQSLHLKIMLSNLKFVPLPFSFISPLHGGRRADSTRTLEQWTLPLEQVQELHWWSQELWCAYSRRSNTHPAGAPSSPSTAQRKGGIECSRHVFRRFGFSLMVETLRSRKQKNFPLSNLIKPAKKKSDNKTHLRANTCFSATCKCVKKKISFV